MPVSIGKSGSSKISTKNVFKTQGLGTVDSNHKEKMDEFRQQKEDLPEKKERISELQAKLSDFTGSLREKAKIEEEIQELTEDIERTENNADEYKYLLDTGLLLYQYYDCLNNPVAGGSARPKQAWKKRSRKEEEKDRRVSLRKQKTNRGEDESDNSVRLTRKNGVKIMKRSEMLDEYKSIVDPNWVKKIDNRVRQEESICEECQVPKILQYRESKYVCPNCGIEETTFIDSDRPSFKDPPPEANYFAYKRINHFNELLAQFQAKESTHIPKEVFDMIKKELKKERKGVKDLDYDLVKGYLKKHSDKKYNQYYDHIFHIINRLNGDKPLSMTPEMESNLRYLFLQIQDPFDKYCPEDRKNFISYNFVFYKFCQMLGYKEFLKYFPLLKSKDKLYEQEKIWQKIMVEIGISPK